MTRKEVVQVIVGAFVSLVLTFIAWQSSRWSTSFDELSKSVVSLNTKIEVLVVQVSNSTNDFNNKLADHESRIRENERDIIQLKEHRK